MKIGTPPIALVQTWIEILQASNIDIEVKKRARTMLKEKIGNDVEILSFVRKHNIKVRIIKGN